MTVRKKTGKNFLLKALLLSAAVFCMFPFGFSQGEESLPIPENPLKGSKVFFDKGCIKCHTIMRAGDSFGPDLTSIGRQKDFYELIGALWSHSPKMIDIMRERDIERPELSPEETEELISFVYYQGFFDELGNPSEGERIYTEKRCGRCHSLGGEAEKAGPPLDKFGRYISPVFIASALWNHSSDVSEAMIGQSFRPLEMSHLLAYFKENALNRDGETVFIEPGNPKKGQEVFAEKSCQVCHGPRGQDLRNSLLQRSLTEIVGMMWNHSDLMWEEMQERGLRIPRFDNREMADLVAFLYFIPYFGEEGNHQAGEKVFEEKGCLSCHSEKAVAEEKGIDLTSVSHYSLFKLVSAMWNHVPAMEKMLTDFNLVWPRFEENEMRDMILFLQSLK
jgi:cytochrome c2